ncbi:MAG: hypothetical protein GX415_00450 [Chloroflexi bacterium]|nr:hypothetical protein [Anaerolineaceae bacterium]NLI43880.1 hypothetical protein [Chloroflexota bacterium]HOT24981.1 hypothetical protein [Anaerolineaceae bacterium]HQH57575.1 hypothetical protein [Anaerolineaceae bacterium]HQK03101.1 hypothetical protein [Anaerolineaceae bacterium]
MTTIKGSESGATVRNRLSKSIVLAIRLLMRQQSPDALSRDLAAYVVLALEKIAESVEVSASAWEKRDYWLKADRFRQEWAWCERSAKALASALRSNDWTGTAQSLAEIGQRLSAVEVSQNNRLGEPWKGAWEIFLRR